MSKNQTKNTLGKNEQMVFEEISRWQRYLNSTTWIITSFFISLNFLIIREANNSPVNNVVEKNVFWGLVFTMLCIIEWMLPTTLTLTSLNVADLVGKKSNKSSHLEDLSEALSFKWSDFFSKNIFKATLKPWGIVNSAFTLFFILTWWELIYNIEIIQFGLFFTKLGLFFILLMS